MFRGGFDMKLGSKVTVHCNDLLLGNQVFVMLTGILLGETSQTITIGSGPYIFVICWKDVVYLERDADNL